MSARARAAGRALAAAAVLAALAAAGAPAFADPLPPQMHTFAGGGDCVGSEASGGPCDGVPATSVPIAHARSVAALPGGGFLYVDRVAGLVREVSPSGVVTTLAGNGTSADAPDGALAVRSGLNGPVAVAPLPGGGFLITEYAGSVVRMVSSDDPATATIDTIAGTGTPGYNGDEGRATGIELSYPTDAEPTADGRVLVADSGNGLIRLVAAPWGGVTLRTIAGGGACDDATTSCEGRAASAVALHEPSSVSPIDGGARGYLLAEYGSSSVRRIGGLAPDAPFSTVAGTPGHAGFAGDGGPARAAQLDHPKEAVATADGGILIADTDNERVRRVAPDGTIATVAGDGRLTLAGDGGAATAASLQSPAAVAPTADGGFLIADEDNGAVRAVTIPPTTAIALDPPAPNGRGGWYVSSVHATAAATNAAATSCALDPAAPPPVFDVLPTACPLAGAGTQVAGDGPHALYAASVDAAGDKELPVGASLKIDATPPALGCRGTPSFAFGARGAQVSAAVTDATSGPASAVVAAAAPTTRLGRRSAAVTGFDNAGNAATVRCAYRVLALRFAAPPVASWTFVAGPASGGFQRFVVRRVAVRATVRVACRGTGCPFAARSLRVRGRRVRGRRATAAIDLERLFAHRRLGLGAQVVVGVGRAGTVGWTAVLTVRASQGLAQRVACLAPGSWTRRTAC